MTVEGCYMSSDCVMYDRFSLQNYRSDALTALLDAGGNASTVSSQWRMSTAHMCAVASDRFCWEAITQTDPIACQRLDACVCLLVCRS